jgi:adenine-specific DNA-methyltransferase
MSKPFSHARLGAQPGVIYTKNHIVELILDLVGYTPNERLTSRTLLEPACGHGNFLRSAVERLLRSSQLYGESPEQWFPCLRAFELDKDAYQETCARMTLQLEQANISSALARALVSEWVQHSDFLTHEFSSLFDTVVGNPPYVRIEHLDPSRRRVYRERYHTLVQRADLYVAFIERSLQLLSPLGKLSFICSGRWTSAQYGSLLRSLIVEHYRLTHYFDLNQASPFETKVASYPGIFAIQHGTTDHVHLQLLADASPSECQQLQSQKPWLSAIQSSLSVPWFSGTEAWVIKNSEHIQILRRLEQRFPPLSQFAKVGVGVATGCDQVFIVPSSLDVEASRLVPIVMRNDWERIGNNPLPQCLLNTFDDDGKTVDLALYPKLNDYLIKYQVKLRGRYIAKKNPRSWYRTIDSFPLSLVRSSKLLIPDISEHNRWKLDPGNAIPHHNLYYVTSTTWDLEVLGALLSSHIALFFLRCYAPAMRGGYLRFQAQFLRKICLPDPNTLSPLLASDLKAAFQTYDQATIDRLAAIAFQCTEVPILNGLLVV